MHVGQTLDGLAVEPPASTQGAPVQTGAGGPVVPNLFHFAQLTELMLEHFGDRWLTEGSIDVRYVTPLHVGDTLTPRSRVTAVEPAGGAQRVDLEIWCENQNGAVLATGTARCVLAARASV